METKKQEDIRVTGQFIIEEVQCRSRHISGQSVQLQTKDVLTATQSNLDGFDLIYTRKVISIPENYVEVSVSASISVLFDNEAGRKTLKTLDSVNEWIENNKVRIVNTFGVPQMVSALITNVVTGVGFMPYVTPPVVLNLSGEAPQK